MNDHHPTVAVVIPLFNKGPHIERALQTVFDQITPVQEIIIVDDASTDDGLARVRALSDARIQIIERNTPGPGGYAARNAGIMAAKSEWIAFLDADDTWRTTAILEVHRLASHADSAVGSIFTAYDRDYGDSVAPVSAFDTIIPQGQRRFDFDTFLEAWLVAGHSPMWTSAVVARRSTLIEAGMFPAGRCLRGGDKDTWLRLLGVADALGSARVTASYHRDSVNMVTKTTSMNHYPYLCGTLQSLLPTGSKRRDALIGRLINYEILASAKEAYRNEARLDADVYRGFNWKLDMRAFAQILAMKWLPPQLIAIARRFRNKVEQA